MRTRRGLIRWIHKKLLKRLEEVSMRWRDFDRDEQALLDSKEIDHGDLNLQQQLAGELDALSEAERTEVQGILAALARIDDGTYGICQECGELLGDSRLVAYPLATCCLDCTELAEEPKKRRSMPGGSLVSRVLELLPSLPDLSDDDDPEGSEEVVDTQLVANLFGRTASVESDEEIEQDEALLG